MGNATLETSKHSDVLPFLDVLCSGTTPPNPSAVIGSAKLSALLAKVIDEYDMVILDSPPLLAVNDSLVLASQVDGIVLVASAGQTTQSGIGGRC